MTKLKTSKFILIIISFLFPVTTLQAQNNNNNKTPREHGVQFSDNVDTTKQVPIHFLQGFSVGIDLAGAIMYKVSSYGQLEGQLHINLKETYFPVIELGIGHTNHSDDETSLHYKTNAPYIRIGCDYNFNKDKGSKNRIYGGLRYGFTTFKYDLDGPNMTDPVWGTVIPYSFKNLSSNCSWLEFVFGLEAKIWSDFHIGWSIRYKRRLSQKLTPIGQAWYIPGLGKNDAHLFSGTFNLIFDI